jgi:hypothetical protein
MMYQAGDWKNRASSAGWPGRSVQCPARRTDKIPISSKPQIPSLQAGKRAAFHDDNKKYILGRD